MVVMIKEVGVVALEGVAGMGGGVAMGNGVGERG